MIRCDSCKGQVIQDDKKSSTHYYYCPACKKGVSVHRDKKEPGDKKQ